MSPKTMNAHSIGIDANWWEADALAALAAISAYLKINGSIRDNFHVSPINIIKIADKIITRIPFGSYHTDDRKRLLRYLERKPSATTIPRQAYYLPRIRGNSDNLSVSSAASGGILYEDPFWFLIAALSVRLTGELFIIPRCSSPIDIWLRRKIVAEDLFNGRFQPKNFFLLAHSIDENRLGLPTDLLKVSGDDLDDLRIGMSKMISIPGEPYARYEMYIFEDPAQIR